MTPVKHVQSLTLKHDIVIYKVHTSGHHNQFIGGKITHTKILTMFYSNLQFCIRADLQLLRWIKSECWAYLIGLRFWVRPLVNPAYKGDSDLPGSCRWDGAGKKKTQPPHPLSNKLHSRAGLSVASAQTHCCSVVPRGTTFWTCQQLDYNWGEQIPKFQGRVWELTF